MSRKLVRIATESIPIGSMGGRKEGAQREGKREGRREGGGEGGRGGKAKDQLLNMEGVLEWENPHFTVIMV